LPPPESGDSRADVVLRGADGAGTQLHLDVGPTGRLGELIPGDECLRAR